MGCRWPRTARAGARRWCSMSDLVRIDETLWEIPAEERPDMRVPARVFADAELLDAIRQDLSLEQLANVATLPGIVGAALAMPDIHQGYGFPVGGVAAFEAPDGIVSPGGVGYDINCGVRLLALPLTETELNGRREAFVHELSRAIPAGMGKPGQLRLRGADLDRVLREGPRALSSEGSEPATTSSARSLAAAFPAPTLPPCPSAPGSAAPVSWARSAPGTTSSRCSASRTFTTRSPPRPAA